MIYTRDAMNIRWIIALALAMGCGPTQSSTSSSTVSDTRSRPGVADTPPARPEAPAPSPWAALELGFEDSSLEPWTTEAEGYEAALDTDHAHSGRQSVRLFQSSEEGVFGAVTGEIPLGDLRGKRLRLSGQVKTRDVEPGQAALWIRVKGPKGNLAFDNLRNRGVTGTADWTRLEATVEIADEAESILFGGYLLGGGTVWFDSLHLEVLPPTPPPSPVVIEGLVQSADGAPVADAHVAANLPMGNRASALTHSGPDGRFRVEVMSGSYVLTATAPGHAATFTRPMDFPGDSPAAKTEPVVLRLGSGGFTVRGSLADPNGKPVPGMIVQVFRMSDDVGDLFYVESDAKGRFDITLNNFVSGFYFLVEDDAVFVDQRTMVTEAKDQTIALVVHRREPATPEVVQWLKSNAIALGTVEAGNGFADMQPLRRVIGNARVVGLGEATHGTREFFQLKHRMLEYLVEQLGFTVFAIEANFTESLVINDYVLHGKGDAKKALAGIYFWTWNTEEVLELIEWMRRYNADASHKKKIEFYGFDMQFAGVAGPEAIKYITGLDKARGEALAAAIAPVTSRGSRMSYGQKSDEEKKAVKQAIADGLSFLDRNRTRAIAATSKDGFAIARRNLVVVQQAETMMGDQANAFEHRDRAMAANLEWILAHKGRGTRVAAWAHNGHIQRDRLNRWKNMGYHLARALGRRYVTFGFAFNQGSYQAIHQPPDGKGGGLQEITVGPAPAGNIGATFARTGTPLFALDLRKRPRARRGKAPHPATRWLETPHMMRNPGAVYSTDEGSMAPQNLARLFDVMLFVDATTRARPVE